MERWEAVMVGSKAEFGGVEDELAAAALVDDATGEAVARERAFTVKERAEIEALLAKEQGRGDGQAAGADKAAPDDKTVGGGGDAAAAVVNAEARAD